ncbi:ketopantoate reductase family protein [Aromatoleum sp.]|uniref:ketopantoate reductase family protein n=1 Tax=Aromatoleum sp. TaxID=2307007 RepID=UPI002FCB8E0C
MSTDHPEETPGRYPIAIVGAGALGLSFAARLAGVGPIAVVARNEARARALRSGIEVGGQPIRIAAFTAADAPRADYVIILVKAGDTEAAARCALAMRPKAVLSLQNGLVEERLREVLGALPCGQGVTTAGAWRDGERVVPAGLGETLVPPGFEPVAEQLSRAGLPARVEREIYAARLAKLLVNLAINPVTALFRVPNGALADPPYRICVEALVREAWPVLRAEGLVLNEAAAKTRVFDVIAGTAENRSSMLQDVLAGRPTEIDALTVAFLSLAARHRAEVPTHAALCHLLRLSEASRLGTAASQR